jgi:hypothetical protein
VSPQDLVALFRRHIVALAVLFVIVAGLAYHIQRTKPLYMSTATVSFIAPTTRNMWGYGESLLAMDEIMAYSMMSPSTQQAIEAAGGTASYDVTLVNLNNEDYPNYSDPYVTVTSTSSDPAATQDTFTIVMRRLVDELDTQQARLGGPPSTWIRTATIAPPQGPVAQTGYPKRTLGGLAVLAIIAAFMVSTFLDQHPFRLRSALGIVPEKGRARPRAEVD